MYMCISLRDVHTAIATYMCYTLVHAVEALMDSSWANLRLLQPSNFDDGHLDKFAIGLRK